MAKRIAVIRTDLTDEDEEKLRELLPGEDVEFVKIAPESPEHLVQILEEQGPFEFSVLRPVTLVEKALDLGHRFILPSRHNEGVFVELLTAPPVLTKPLHRPGTRGSLGY